ncbi:MAG TPA: 4-hydroxy-tetrahydrodipicolinate reductase [Candidatus Omnitrophota bacterium]|nr:4-hydroxy-tetrahydrodipicolinate reductase [Candidatus Omnitrophota bacterium]HOX09768.1 4-hydroxy-tetrahydrodipicolinate reductase [Candidatus Omnitrophota bacterium]
MVKIAICGCAGKMGARILYFAEKDKQISVTLGLEAKGHPCVGSKMGSGEVSDNCDDVAQADVIIDFTSPEATMEHLDAAVRCGKAIVIGTTGLSDAQLAKIKEASAKIPVVQSPNMSIGVNLLFRLVKEAAEKLSGDYLVRMVEAHHIHKKDSPSGTAKKLAQIIKESSMKEVGDIKSIREGEIVGDHKVTFESPYDIIELSHSAKTRDIFAKGAIAAAKFVAGKKPKLYDMQDVLGAAK